MIAGNVQLNSPPNAICACVGETLNYTCTIAVDPGSPTGSTVWSGSAFMCAGNEIPLIHDRFNDGTSGQCNERDIIARSVGVEGMNYTSELNVTVRDGLNGKAINCSWDLSPGPGPSSTITVASKYITLLQHNTLSWYTISYLESTCLISLIPIPGSSQLETKQAWG